MKTRVGFALLLFVGAPAWSACNMDLTDNTWKMGLDVNDMSQETQARIAKVLEFHFTPDVEMLRKGSSGALPGDIEYTLRSVPNHYRALMAYSKWELQNPHLAAAQPRTAECYFKRAIAFRPEDPQIHSLFGTYLHWAKRLPEARAEYDKAEGMGLSSAEHYYNRGLLECDLGNLQAARKYADLAYGMGYPLPGLRKRLQRMSSGTRPAEH